jgi:transcriptional regulator with XRE-family HTH domain
MDTSINQRLKEYCEYYNIKQNDIVLKTNLGKDQVSKWFNNVHPISVAGLVSILSNFKIDARWLILNEGNMVNESMDTSEDPEEQYKPKPDKKKKQAYEDRIINLENTVALLTKLLSEAKEGGYSQGEVEGSIESPGKNG